jgi:hypothetical protein
MRAKQSGSRVESEASLLTTKGIDTTTQERDRKDWIVSLKSLMHLASRTHPSRQRSTILDHRNIQSFVLS